MHLTGAEDVLPLADRIIDLEQPPGDLIILSAKETDLSLLGLCHQTLETPKPSLRLASLLQLKHPASLDLYYQNTLQHAKAIVAVLLGGQSYWPYLLEKLKQHIQKYPQCPTVIINGEDPFDPLLSQQSNTNIHTQQTIHTYLHQGGKKNHTNLLRYLQQQLFQHTLNPQPPQTLPNLIYQNIPATGHSKQQPSKPLVPLLYYKNYYQTDTHAFIKQWPTQQLQIFPIAIDSLKNKHTQQQLQQLFKKHPPSTIINTTGFCANTPLFNVPVIQAIISNQNIRSWRKNPMGLLPSDLTMQITLPEIDGRIISTATIFKHKTPIPNQAGQHHIQYHLHQNHAKQINTLARNYHQLQTRPNPQKKIAIILNHYPNLDSRIGNAVGLDTAASLIHLLKHLKQQHYHITPLPKDPSQLMALIKQTKANPVIIHQQNTPHTLPIEDYQTYFRTLPADTQQKITQQWGTPEEDPYYLPKKHAIAIAGLLLGHIFIGIQPSRGHHHKAQQQHQENYHSPTLAPPHYYLAFYRWLSKAFQTHAVLHFGKHGNLEWLPGKSTALSNLCFPKQICPAIPHIYPFIVNDPGEGTQAKRRSHAVIIDHLMPPIERADNYGQMCALEDMLDEYHQASYADQPRTKKIAEKITQLSEKMGIGREIKTTNINQIDNYLCEIKETTIRSGLHILGKLPPTHKLTETLLCLATTKRGPQPEQQAIKETISIELLGQNIFTQASHEKITATQPPQLSKLHKKWHTISHAKQAVHLYALQLIHQRLKQPHASCPLPHTQKILNAIMNELLPKLQQSAHNEINHTMAALSGQFTPPGPSGAPSRGRWDVLPTGRNFYGIDHQYIPTPTAYEIGSQSAQLLLETYLQEHGQYPKSIGLSVWATSTMRTGGDDIAQAMALMGIRPVWCMQSARVTGLQIIPTAQLGRPRVDVTLRISGMFRDAFMHVVYMLEEAIDTLAKQNEKNNPIYHHTQSIKQKLQNAQQPTTHSSTRIFGSKPGGYGAGIQHLIDNKNWQNKSELAQTYIQWSQYAYGRKMFGAQDPHSFCAQLKNIDLVMHNQDNREHDILDSDDYYQFQGGMIAAATHLGNTQIKSYFGDNSNPSQPKVHTLAHEINKVMRARVLNPKWLSGMQAHGYKGGFEMLATLDYLFGFDATTNLVHSHHYSQLFEQWIQNPQNQAFLTQHNPDALLDMTERFQEAITRGMWQATDSEKQEVLSMLQSASKRIEQ